MTLKSMQVSAKSPLLALWSPALTILQLAFVESLHGQALAYPPVRVAWPLIDLIVLGDSTHGLQVLASPTLQSEQGRGPFQSVIITLEPASARLWAGGVARLVESTAKLPSSDRTPFVTVALMGNRRLSWLRLRLGPKANRERPFDLEIFDSSRVTDTPGPTIWSAPASATEVLALLTALDAVAEHSAVDSASQSLDSTRVYLAEQLDERPRLTSAPDLEYPTAALARRRQGRVWVEYVIDSTGAVRTETIRVLMSDGDDFTKSILSSLARCHYVPGVRRGVPVATLVRAPFVFSIARRVRVPFSITIPQ